MLNIQFVSRKRRRMWNRYLMISSWSRLLFACTEPLSVERISKVNDILVKILSPSCNSIYPTSLSPSCHGFTAIKLLLSLLTSLDCNCMLLYEHREDIYQMKIANTLLRGRQEWFMLGKSLITLDVLLVNNDTMTTMWECSKLIFLTMNQKSVLDGEVDTFSLAGDLGFV